ncbi:hypothetical protein OR1_02228 [Geobacter sp. OR-1]|uniref:hypothetical protein n=1 Tax=Geobacter sp. OR-1 TaxID=1266765 RepID=UPI0005426BEF|nr:hypothetical protein [Geobacter sp. OR-1]GAM09944.1 hypothetical protein OR1_02228 [Geobacter sp. OR-1]
MGKCVRIVNHRDNRFKLLAETLIRAAKLEFLNAPPRMLKKEYALISTRMCLIDTTTDAEKLLKAIEEVLLRNISINMSGTSCLNCTSFYECPNVAEEIPETNDALPPQPYPYGEDAMKLCSEYHPDWDKFDDAAKLYPEILIRLETSFGIVLDRKRVVGKLLDVMGKWSKSAGKRIQ